MVHIVMLHSVLTDDQIRANFACVLVQHFQPAYILENGCNEFLTDFWTIGREKNCTSCSTLPMTDEMYFTNEDSAMM